jgi:serine/threonine protein kinase
MAQVHRAVAAKDAFQRSVALKRMLSHIAGSEDMVKSFVREARLASYLRHENVAQTYDLGRVDDTYFIVMELITGRNLREVLRHCGVTTGPMPVQFALNILNQVCDALDYAHNLCDETGQPLGIIHRDVSPSNVIVSETGVVKLIDFGIAKASGGGMQTMSGTLKGKFAYMAPEYIGGHIDARADLFAVGVIAHELLTNRPLFTGRDDIDTLGRVREMQIPPPSTKNPQVPPEIDDIVMTALERDPERRWQHATALRTALTTLTRRLGLIASNAQVVQWLDWAFSQPSRQGRQVSDDPDTDADTETADKTADQPSISIEQETIEHRTTKQRAVEKPAIDPLSQSSSQKVTLLLGDDAPKPPGKPPIGTPGSLPVQTSSPPASSPTRAPLAMPRPLASPPPLRSPSPVATSALLSSSSQLVSAPLATPARPDASSRHPVLPPRSVAAGTAAPASRTTGAPARTIPILGAAPAFPASRGRSPSAPPPPGFNAVLASPSLGIPASPSSPPPSSAPFAAPRPSAPSISPAPAAPRPTSPILIAILVLLAAAGAAITVYFVLPLLT